MEGNIPQPNQERNLALERQEAVKLHNDILKDKENFEAVGKESTDRDSQMQSLREKVQNIDKYRNLAKEFDGNRYYYNVGDISSVEKLTIQKEKIDKEVERVKSMIEETSNELNELRKKLGMEPTEDIPSLIIKKERLPYLYKMQQDLEGKLNSENKKVEAQKEENFENKQRENKNFSSSIESINSDINNLSKSLEERQSNGYNQIFQNQEVFRTLASSAPDVSNFEEIKNYFSNIKNAIEIENEKRGNGINDNAKNLYNVSSLLKKLAINIQEFTSKIQNEKEKKEIVNMTASIIENLDKVSSFVSKKAQALEAYENNKF